MFRPVENNVSFPKLEGEIARYWREAGIYDKSLKSREGGPKFVFYEGPPTANGMPHPGHCLTRAIKDLFPRYRTMRGFYCRRKAGWDTHGLPVEVEVCKELGIHSKEEIERYGVEPFIHKCQQSVWRYMKEWEQLTERLGFWIHLDQAYVTYHQSYVESVWWSLKNLFDRGLLYQGHKIVWWWAQGGTALSSGEVGQGYRQVADPSVYVKFPLLDDTGKPTDTSLLVWTTTPWTLPSNQFAAVHPGLDYVTVNDTEHGKLIIAAALVESIAAKVKREFSVVGQCKGREFVGRRYQPPFDYYSISSGQKTGRLAAGGQQHVAWRVVPADFVTIDSGTGIVHQAPAFGEVDYDVLLSEQARFVGGEGPPLICAVAPDGTFTAEAPDYQGRWVKDCDKDIVRELKQRGLLFHQEQYLHDYPFCWRAEEDPLIQYPRKSWFIRTTQFKDAMLANNRQINWLPEHIRDGRFGNFLETNVDWALSRERYWGTPLPIWVCDVTGKMEAVASYDELIKKPGLAGLAVWEEAKKTNPSLPEDLKVHKPYIDAITYDSPFAEEGRMTRVSEVIDCWYDSGAMPFAQWGYPHAGQADFDDQFPADFISEALDQTRGWFYSLLAISTMVHQGSGVGGQGSERSGSALVPSPQPLAPSFPHPFRNCIVLGLMLGEDGQKMSKSKRNYREPAEIFDRYGADALRWFFFAKQPPWTTIRYSEQAIKDSIPEFLLRLWNCYSFFVIYANIDGFDPAAKITGAVRQLDAAALAKSSDYRPIEKRRPLDHWILGELDRTAAQVTAAMDAYDNFTGCQRITEFVDALSNWYVRRSRDRFWAEDKRDPDKLDAYWTLYECLLTVSKIIAPFTPFIAEAMWQNLAVAEFGDRALESVHLCDFPIGEPSRVDEELAERIALGREIASLGRAARTAAKLKVRQPLAKVEIVLADQRHRTWLEEYDAAVRDELNVKDIEYLQSAEQYITYTVLPDLKRLGPRLGKRLPMLKQKLAELDAASLLAKLKTDGQVTLNVADGDVVLDNDDIQVRLQAKPGWSAAQGTRCVVILNTELTDDLLAEGLAREVVRAIQDRRKEMSCDFTDRIAVGLVSDDAALAAAVEHFGEVIRGETLAVELVRKPLPGADASEIKLDGKSLTLYVKVVPA
jgi:isoleucyl-tRNA synthetase